MMPLIQPLPNAYSKPTEYQKERAQAAELEVELRRRKRWVGRLRGWLSGARTALSRLGWGRMQFGAARRAQR